MEEIYYSWCNKDNWFNNIIQKKEMEVDILEESNITKKTKQKKDKLPFAVFICPKSNTGDTVDYKQVFTDIISDRIKEKYG